MVKPTIIGTIAVFVLWSVLNFAVHGGLLMGLYEAHASV
jgi:hypothetical protein